MARSRTHANAPVTVELNREVALTGIGAVAVIAALAVALIAGTGAAKSTPGVGTTKTPAPRPTHVHSYVATPAVRERTVNHLLAPESAS